jgi:hypothetical protein
MISLIALLDLEGDWAVSSIGCIRFIFVINVSAHANLDSGEQSRS